MLFLGDEALWPQMGFLVKESSRGKQTSCMSQLVGRSQECSRLGKSGRTARVD